MHRRMAHRIGGEARRGVGVAVAALYSCHRNMRRRRHARRRRSIVAIAAIGIRGRVREFSARPAHIAATSRRSVTRDAILAIGRNVPWVGRRAIGAFGALPRICSVMAAVAARRRHRRMAHRLGGEARRRVAMAVRHCMPVTGRCGGVFIYRSPSRRYDGSPIGVGRARGQRSPRPSSQSRRSPPRRGRYVQIPRGPRRPMTVDRQAEPSAPLVPFAV